MPFSDYAGLQSSVAAWIDRDDLAAAIPDFITLAEARLNDRLRTAEMENLAVLQSSNGTATLPDDFLAARIVVARSGVTEIVDDVTQQPISDAATGAIWITEFGADATAYVLRGGDPNGAIDDYGGLGAGCPRLYTIVGDILTVHPTAAATLSLIYYAKIPALSEANPTNWLLTKRPQIYLYASLLESAPFLQDDARVTLWKAALEEAIGNYESADQMARWGNAGLRLPGPVV